MNRLKLTLLAVISVLQLNLSAQIERKEKKEKEIFQIVHHNFGLTANASLYRFTGMFDYRYNVKKMVLTFRYGYGQIGKKKFGDLSKQDAYSGWYNFPLDNGGYFPVGFHHNFIGHSIGIGGGRNFFIGQKSSISITLNFDVLLMEDRFLLLFNQQESVERSIKRNAFDFALDVDYFYKINDFLSINVGLVLPFIAPYFKDPGVFGFQPVGMYIPALGFEPYLKAGVQFNVRKLK